MLIETDTMDLVTRRVCYPFLEDGELDAMDGPVFGRAFLVIGRKDVMVWTPSECEECDDPAMLYAWVNYNYRCCQACWAVIKTQLWETLTNKVTERPANRVWAFLIEPAQH